eukprot:SAG31_NODE_3507_length_4183_cov_2.185113_3_plen_549_part_00
MAGSLTCPRLKMESCLAVPHHAATLCARMLACAGNSNCFEILGFDVLLDSKLKPWLIEVNHSPSFNTDSPMDAKIKGQLIRDTLSLVNVRSSDKRKYSRELRSGFAERNYGLGGPSMRQLAEQLLHDPNAAAAATYERSRSGIGGHASTQNRKASATALEKAERARDAHEQKSRGGFTLIWPTTLLSEAEVARLQNGAELIHSGQLRPSNLDAATKRQLGLAGPFAPKRSTVDSEGSVDDMEEPAVSSCGPAAAAAAAATASRDEQDDGKASMETTGPAKSSQEHRAAAAAAQLAAVRTGTSVEPIKNIESVRDIEKALAAIDSKDRPGERMSGRALRSAGRIRSAGSSKGAGSDGIRDNGPGVGGTRLTTVTAASGGSRPRKCVSVGRSGHDSSFSLGRTSASAPSPNALGRPDAREQRELRSRADRLVAAAERALSTSRARGQARLAASQARVPKGAHRPEARGVGHANAATTVGSSYKEPQLVPAVSTAELRRQRLLPSQFNLGSSSPAVSGSKMAGSAVPGMRWQRAGSLQGTVAGQLHNQIRY